MQTSGKIYGDKKTGDRNRKKLSYGRRKQLKRRIERIFHGTKKKKCFPVVVLVTIFLCSATAIGYQKPGGPTKNCIMKVVTEIFM